MDALFDQAVEDGLKVFVGAIMEWIEGLGTGKPDQNCQVSSFVPFHNLIVFSVVLVAEKVYGNAEYSPGKSIDD